MSHTVTTLQAADGTVFFFAVSFSSAAAAEKVEPFAQAVVGASASSRCVVADTTAVLVAASQGAAELAVLSWSGDVLRLLSVASMANGRVRFTALYRDMGTRDLADAPRLQCDRSVATPYGLLTPGGPPSIRGAPRPRPAAIVRRASSSGESAPAVASSAARSFVPSMATPRPVANGRVRCCATSVHELSTPRRPCSSLAVSIVSLCVVGGVIAMVVAPRRDEDGNGSQGNGADGSGADGSRADGNGADGNGADGNGASRSVQGACSAFICRIGSIAQAHKAEGGAQMLQARGACCVALDERTMRVAVGSEDGTVQVHTLCRPPAGPGSSLTRMERHEEGDGHRNDASGDDGEVFVDHGRGALCLSVAPWSWSAHCPTGPVRCLAFASTADSLAVGYDGGGAAVFGACGTLQALWPLHGAGMALVGGLLARGVGSIAWGPGDLHVLSSPKVAVPSSSLEPAGHEGSDEGGEGGAAPVDGCVCQLAMLRHAGAPGCAHAASGGHLVLLGSDHVRIARTASLATSPPAWRAVRVPSSYLRKAWPLLVAAVHGASSLAVAGERGVAVCHLPTERWRTPPSALDPSARSAHLVALPISPHPVPTACTAWREPCPMPQASWAPPQCSTSLSAPHSCIGSRTRRC